jgi:hypothetical protein
MAIGDRPSFSRPFVWPGAPGCGHLAKKALSAARPWALARRMQAADAEVQMTHVNASEVNKCAHPACNCRVSSNSEFGNYCSQHCEQAKDIVELKCDCGHPACKL